MAFSRGLCCDTTRTIKRASVQLLYQWVKTMATYLPKCDSHRIRLRMGSVKTMKLKEMIGMVNNDNGEAE
jgi:hypothetical protein